MNRLSFAQRIAALSPEQRERLENRLKSEGIDISQHTREFAPILPAEKKEYYDLSSAQKSLYVLQQLEPGSIGYNVPNVMGLDKDPDKQKIAAAIKQLIHRHESLRTSFEMVDELPVQRIHDYVPFEIQSEEISPLAKGDGGSETENSMIKQRIRSFIQPFDLSRAPLLKVTLLKLSTAQHLLLFDIHHIITDNTSQVILTKEFLAIYSGEELPLLRVQYKDYVQWQHSHRKQERMKQQEAYWTRQFSREPPLLNLPTDYPRPLSQSFEGNMVSFEFNQGETKKINTLAQQEETTLFMTLLAIFVILLSKLSGQDEIVVGTPTAGRRHIDIEQMVGYFINTLPIKSYPSGEKTFKKFLQEIRIHTAEVFENQDYPFNELVERLLYQRDISRHPIFDIVFNLLDHSKAPDDPTKSVNSTASYREYKNLTTKFDIGLIAIRLKGTLTLAFEYCTKLFKRETIEKLFDCYCIILTQVLADTSLKISHINILSEEEKKLLLFNYNQTKVRYPGDKTLQEIFAEQLEKIPGKIAVVCDGKTYTYRYLAETSNQLAGGLRAKGIKPGNVVAFMLERSPQLIVVMLAILKTGAAYLPIDTNYPAQRLTFILKDSQTSILITQPGLLAREDTPGLHTTIVDVSEENLYSFEKTGTEKISHPDDLAYIIYTSGSTGIPKGVMVEHRNIVRFVKPLNYMDLSENDRLLMTGLPVFDISTFEIWGPLLNGLTLYLVDEDIILDAVKLGKALAENKITILHLIPQLFNQLAPQGLEIFSGLRYLMVGGDLVQPTYINDLRTKNKRIKILHMYGPTENTTFSTFLSVDQEYERGLPIGKPIDNSTVYIFNTLNQLQPVGVAGELCTGGEGVSRGYLNNPELTCEKFIDNPYIPGERLYKTGDLARWLADGNLSFLGRSDQQVKVRGNRIEPGEIENRLLKYNHITEVVVISRENEKEEKYLIAYITADEALQTSELQEYLAHQLPTYMIPAYFIQLEHFPLTHNGKIDRKALPEPQLEESEEYIAPRTPIEKKLVEIWKEILGKTTLGITDNFFMIGGDSIKAIQIAARMKKVGYRFGMRDIFQNPTISKLAPLIKKVERVADQDAVTGSVPLTPIQETFFQNNRDDPHHFNQAVMLKFTDRIDERAVNSVFMKIQQHHDALRMTFQEEKGKILQINQGLDLPLSLQVFDLRDRQEPLALLQKQANEIQSSINLRTGPLMKLGLFHLPEGDRLLIVIHHLVMDGVSWRVLFEDIEHLNLRCKMGESLQLPPKTDSYKRWAEKLREYADSDALLKEKNHWAQLEAMSIPEIKKDFTGNNYVEDSHTLSFNLGEEKTHLLLTEVNEAFTTRINDLLLSALGLSIKKTFDIDKIVIHLEGHGREQIFAELDVSRTVGWFTSIYPVLLDISFEKDLSRQLKEIKEGLHQSVHQGIGYGILKYLTPVEKKSDIEFRVKPRFRFNYLGQFDEDLQRKSFAVAEETLGNTVHLKKEREYELDVSGIVANKELLISITYSTKQYAPQTVQRFLNHYQDQLNRIIAHCLAQKKKQRTPSDLTHKNLTIDDMDAITWLLEKNIDENIEIEDIYPLSPMQEGMFFHSLMDKSSSIYLHQISYRILGNLHIPVVEKSLNELFKRHDILRTVFIQDKAEKLLQVVLKERCIEFHYEDISGKPDKENYLIQFKEKDKKQGFDLSKHVLMRVAVFQVDEEEYEFVWSKHHILMDGWCFGILISEFSRIYDSSLQNRPYRLPRVTPYRRFIQWLEGQDRDEAREYWEKYLQAYTKMVGIPGKEAPAENRGRGQAQRVSFQLNAEKINGLKKLAAKHDATLNSIFHTIWAIILGKYNARTDVVFGAVVSGRPSEIPGIESMVGLFINTVPVRIRYQEKTKFKDLLRQVQEEAVESENYHYYPLKEIQATITLRQNLLDHILVFENYPGAQEIDGIGMMKPGGPGQENPEAAALKLSKVELFDSSNYDFYVLIVPGEPMVVTLDYYDNIYEKELMQRIARHFSIIVEQVLADEAIPIDQLIALSEEEQTRIIDGIRGEKGEGTTKTVTEPGDRPETLKVKFNF